MGGGESPPAALGEIGWLASELRLEFPQLRLISLRLQTDPEAIAAEQIERQLRSLSDRFTGGRAVELRRQPVPAAYRVFYRQIGLDPEVTRTPVEAAILTRLLDGGFLPGAPLENLLLSVLVETAVPVWALDAGKLDGPLGLRLSRGGERFGRGGERTLPTGTLVVADASCPLAVLFGEIAQGHQSDAHSRELALFTIQVAGVPTMHIQEALWMCHSALASGPVAS